MKPCDETKSATFVVDCESWETESCLWIWPIAELGTNPVVMFTPKHHGGAMRVDCYKPTTFCTAPKPDGFDMVASYEAPVTGVLSEIIRSS
jgi:hypothetical protein